MRVYLPATLSALAEAHVAGGFEAGSLSHALTPAVREWYIEGDDEELEYVALTAAAQASLSLLASELAAQARHEHRRVVVAADVPSECATPSADVERTAVRLSCRVAMSAIASIHVDEDTDEARQVVAAAIMALPAAAEGDEDALFALEEAKAQDLLWYDSTEILDLI